MNALEVKCRGDVGVCFSCRSRFGQLQPVTQCNLVIDQRGIEFALIFFKDAEIHVAVSQSPMVSNRC